MKALTKIFIVIVFLSSMYSCLPQKKVASGPVTVSALEKGSGIKEGSIVYSLPMTVLNIRIDLERVTEMPGPYARYASDLLGLSKVIMNESEHWSIKAVHVVSQQEADPSEYYVIAANSLYETNALSLKKEGLILDLNPAIYAPSRSQTTGNGSDLNDFQTYDLGANEYFRIQRDTAYKNVSLDTSFVRIPYLVEKKKRLSTDQLAEKAAARLMELREGKVLILTGESNVFPQSEAALNEINRLEKEYLELFAGKRWTESRSLTFQVVPKKEMTGNPQQLFRFSMEAGPLTGNQPGGVPVTINFTPEQKTKELTVVKNAPSETEENAVQPPAGLFYRVPDVVGVTVNQGNDVFYSSRKLIFQFGNVIELPGNYIIGK
jgi:hypothetical protein